LLTNDPTPTKNNWLIKCQPSSQIHYLYRSAYNQGQAMEMVFHANFTYPLPLSSIFTGQATNLYNLQPYMPVIHFINSLYNLRGKHNIDQKNSRMMHLTFLTTSIYEKVLLVWSSSYKKKVNNHFCRHWKCNSRINISLKDENNFRSLPLIKYTLNLLMVTNGS